MLEALELIIEMFYCIQNKRRMNRVALFIKTQYDPIRVLAVHEYLQLLVEGFIKE